MLALGCSHTKSDMARNTSTLWLRPAAFHKAVMGRRFWAPAPSAASHYFPTHLEQKGAKIHTPDAQAVVTAGCCAHLGAHRQSRDAAGVQLVHCLDDNFVAADLVHAACSNTTLLCLCDSAF